MNQTISAATRQAAPLFTSPLQPGAAVPLGRWLGLGLLFIFGLGIGA